MPPNLGKKKVFFPFRKRNTLSEEYFRSLPCKPGWPKRNKIMMDARGWQEKPLNWFFLLWWLGGSASWSKGRKKKKNTGPKSKIPKSGHKGFILGEIDTKKIGACYLKKITWTVCLKKVKAIIEIRFTWHDSMVFESKNIVFFVSVCKLKC